jgi:diguanylate cyclase (GGDEF)-like protein/PAS domain S-box-containing protein
VKAAEIPVDEQERLAALHALGVLDTPPEAEFDALVFAAARVCDAPIALITLIDADRQWFKASVGLPGIAETPRIVSFCGYAILTADVFVVPDAAADQRFADNPLVTGNPDIRFYAGAPLALEGGQRIGTLCVIDRQPRELQPEQLVALRQLARSATLALESRARSGFPAQGLDPTPEPPARWAATRDLSGAHSVEIALAGAMIGGSDDAIIAKTLDGTVLSWNRGAEHIFGYGAREMIGSSIIRLFPPERVDEEARLLRLIRSGQSVSHFETQRVRKDGSRVDISVTISPIRDRSGRIFAISKIARDISDRVLAERTLREQRELLSVTLSSIADAVVTCNMDGNIDWMNPAAEKLTGWLSAEARNRPVCQVLRFVHQETRDAAPPIDLHDILRSRGAGQGVSRLLLSRDGSEYGVEESAAPILGAGGSLLGVVLVLHDVTEQRRLTGEMTYKATHDGLTGLYNRAEFEVQLRRVLLSAHQNGAQHALLYIDLDQFKLVNDACGHTVGDQLLRQVSRLLMTSFRSRDTLARLGGDEFGAILEDCTIVQAHAVAQKICDRMEEFRFVHELRRFRIGASIGLVPVDERWTSTNMILQAADTACYAAKEAGRNRVHTWFDSDQAMRTRNGEMQWATRIEQALDENRVVLEIQRIVPINRTGGGVHGEVLMRIRERDGELVLPGAFMPAAERFQLATRIDRRVLSLVVDWFLAQDDLSQIELLCVNLSGQSIVDRVFHHHALDLLRSLDPQVRARLCLEITETAVVTNLGDASVFIEQAHALGVRVALDDFGAGASSFSYLKSLDVDFLKIDGQFIQGLLDAPLDRAAVKCFVEVARVIGVPTIAEFVDRAELLAELAAAGVDYAQGFLLHRPEPLTQRVEVLGNAVVC